MASTAVRRWRTAAIVLVIVVAVFAALALLSDWLVRGFAQDAIKVAVAANLPDNVEADVDVRIDGDWVLAQYLSGTMDSVTLSDDAALLNGVPVALSVTAEKVPTDLASPVGEIRATAVLGPEAANTMLSVPGSDPQLALGDGVVTYSDAASVLGFSVGYAVTASAQPDGTDILLAPQAVEVTSDVGGIDVTPFTNTILGGEPVRVCVADYLPVGVTVQSIDITPETATLVFGGRDITLSADALANRGTCG